MMATNTINQAQNEPDFQAAIQVAVWWHRRSSHLIAAQFGLSLIGCALAIAGTFYVASGATVALIGAAIAVVVILLDFGQERCAAQGVEAQDAFDRCLYGLIAVSDM